LTLLISQQRLLKRTLKAAALALLVLCPVLAHAQDLIGDNASTEARYLFFLGEFIRWPKDKAPALDRPLTVGFAGRSRVEDYFAEANLSRGGGRRVEVVRINNSADLRRCHIVFFSIANSNTRLTPLLREARRRNVLSVGESNDFIRQGGMINFSASGGRMHPQVCVSNLKRADLTPDSRLLRSAEIVNGDGEPEGGYTAGK
jgi:hypothetical protein